MNYQVVETQNSVKLLDFNSYESINIFEKGFLMACALNIAVPPEYGSLVT